MALNFFQSLKDKVHKTLRVRNIMAHAVEIFRPVSGYNIFNSINPVQQNYRLFTHLIQAGRCH